MHFNKTDEEIITSYKEGNLEVFKTIIEKYSSAIYNFSARLVGKDMATDITQEIFIKAWKKLDKFDTKKSSFKTWIFVIAKNTTTDYLRKKRHVNFSEIENNEDEATFSERIPDEKMLPDEALQKIQDKELLNALLEKLTPEDKTILVLHYQEEMTFKEISVILTKPENTIKSYHRRAIIKLRKML